MPSLYSHGLQDAGPSSCQFQNLCIIYAFFLSSLFLMFIINLLRPYHSPLARCSKTGVSIFILVMDTEVLKFLLFFFFLVFLNILFSFLVFLNIKLVELTFLFQRLGIR